MISRSLQHLAGVALLRHRVDGEAAAADHIGAARVFGFVEAHLTALGGVEDLDREYYQSALALLREAIGADELTRLMAAGATMTEDEAVAQAEALEHD